MNGAGESGQRINPWTYVLSFVAAAVAGYHMWLGTTVNNLDKASVRLDERAKHIEQVVRENKQALKETIGPLRKLQAIELRLDRLESVTPQP